MLLSYALRLPRRMAVRRCNLHRRVLSNGVSIRYFFVPSKRVRGAESSPADIHFCAGLDVPLIFSAS